MLKYSKLQKFKNSKIQVFKYSVIIKHLIKFPKLKYSNIQKLNKIFSYSNFKIFK